MNNVELIRLIREDVRAATSPQAPVIEGARLEEYLGRLEASVQTDATGIDQFALERMRAGKDFALENLRQDRASDLEMFRSVLAAGQAALRAAMSINGAAATALLAFCAHLLAKGGPPGLVGSFAAPMGLFVSGVLSATAAFGVNYVTQWLYTRSLNRVGHVSNLVSVALVLASYLGFGVAAWRLYLLFVAL